MSHSSLKSFMRHIFFPYFVLFVVHISKIHTNTKTDKYEHAVYTACTFTYMYATESKIFFVATKLNQYHIVEMNRKFSILFVPY